MNYHTGFKGIHRADYLIDDTQTIVTKPDGKKFYLPHEDALQIAAALKPRSMENATTKQLLGFIA